MITCLSCTAEQPQSSKLYSACGAALSPGFEATVTHEPASASLHNVTLDSEANSDGYTGPANTLPECWQNLIDHDVRDRVTMIVAPYAIALPLIDIRRFGFVYYDADHTYEATRDAFQLLIPDMRSGCHLAVHDYEASYPGVQAAVAEVEYHFADMHVVDRLAILLERKP